MPDSIMKAASNPKSVTNNKSQNEGIVSYFVSRTSWAVVAGTAVITGVGAVAYGASRLLSSNTVNSLEGRIRGEL